MHEKFNLITELSGLVTKAKAAKMAMVIDPAATLRLVTELYDSLVNIQELNTKYQALLAEKTDKVLLEISVFEKGDKFGVEAHTPMVRVNMFDLGYAFGLAEKSIRSAVLEIVSKKDEDLGDKMQFTLGFISGRRSDETGSSSLRGIL